MNKYIVATDREAFYTRLQPAKLYRLEGCRSRAVLAATGTAEQMQELADELNGRKRASDNDHSEEE